MKKVISFLSFIAIIIVFNSCKKEFIESASLPSNDYIKKGDKKNPFSLANFTKVRNKKFSSAAKGLPNVDNLKSDRIWEYVQFNPLGVSGEILSKLESDTNVHIMDIPFGNAELYNENFALNEEKAAQLKDGKLYISFKKESAINDIFLTEPSLEAKFIDELYLPEDLENIDKDLYTQILIEAGFTNEEVAKWFNICLFKRPHGRVNYWDTELNSFQPVAGMQVWTLFWGIPITTYSDNNGWYEIPCLFSIGTIMGTKAKNNRVNIKPLDVHGTVAQNFFTLIVQFIIGSIHIEGWKSSCDMRNDINFNFGGHTQVRFWCHLLNAYALHDEYTYQDGILNAPNAMVCYAGWTNDNNRMDPYGRPAIRDASTPLFGHISYIAALFEYLLNDIFGLNVNLATNSPNLFSIFRGLMPDMYLGVAESQEPTNYSSRIMQTAFHELGHASQFRRVGNAWYTALQWAERPFPNPNSTTGNPYGDGQNANAGIVALAESWSEFIGTEYENRRYGVLGRKSATSTGSLNSNPFNRALAYSSLDLMERESYFFGGNWIPYGVYNDLIDNYNPLELWDNVNGASIQQLYLNFRPNVKDMCQYLFRLRSNFPTTPFEIVVQNYNSLCW